MSADQSQRAKNRARGHAAREAGKEWEDALDGWILRLKQQGLIRWAQANYPHKVGWKFVGATGADRSGFLAGGKPWALEAKSCAPGEDMLRSRITKLQAEHLDETAREGGLSLIAIQFRRVPPDGHDLVLIPWLSAPWAKRITQEVLSPHHGMGPWTLPPDGFCAAFTFQARQVMGDLR